MKCLAVLLVLIGALCKSVISTPKNGHMNKQIREDYYMYTRVVNFFDILIMIFTMNTYI